MRYLKKVLKHVDLTRASIKCRIRTTDLVDLYINVLHAAGGRFGLKISTCTNEDVNYRNALLLRLLFFIAEVTLMI